MSDSRAKIWIAIARVLTGILFVRLALPKFNTDYLLGFSRMLNLFAEGNPFPWYSSFLTNVLMPHQQVAAIALALLELLVGIALVLGFLSGLACLVGMVLSVNFMLATSHVAWSASEMLPAVYVAPGFYTLLLLLLLFITRSGKYYSLGSRLGSSRSFFW